MRTRKESELTSGTHLLETGEGGNRQETEKMRRARDTHFLETAEGLVGPGKERKLARNTHVLEMAKGMICQDKERERPSGGYSLSGDGRWRSQDLSGYRKKETERGALTLWR